MLFEKLRLKYFASLIIGGMHDVMMVDDGATAMVDEEEEAEVVDEDDRVIRTRCGTLNLSDLFALLTNISFNPFSSSGSNSYASLAPACHNCVA